jgi:hypothetical protein
VQYEHLCTVKEHRSLEADNSDRKLAHIPAAGQCEVEVSFENFEGADALDGWENGLLEVGDQQANFTKFLGRYGKDTSSPAKLYKIGLNADHVLVKLDFYEVDSWDRNSEKAFIYIDDEEIALEEYQWYNGDDQKTGTSSKGSFIKKLLKVSSY